MHATVPLPRIVPPVPHPFLLLILLGSVGAEPTPSASPPPVPVAALVDEITTRNPERRFYEEELAAARAGARTASRLADPELSLDLGRKRLREAGGAPAGEGTVWALTVRQTFEWPGRLALRRALADREIALAELGVARFEHALAGRARTLAFGLYAAHARAAAVREVADRFAALRATFLARDPAGLAPLLETRVIEAGELALQRRATAAELAVQAALLELNQLRGAAIDAPLRVAAPVLGFRDLPALTDLLAAARERNFDYRWHRLELERQGLAVRLARHERYPAVSVGPYVSRDPVGGRETIAGVGLSVPLPVSGRGAAAAEMAEARRRQAESAALVALRELEREVVASAQAFAAKLAELRRWPAEAVAQFRATAELADRHYRLGAVPVATYVELQQSYLDAIEALLDTQAEVLAAGLRLQQLTGLELDPVEVRS